jgi:hypothetical protein
MADIKIDTNKPAPKFYRRFENAYIIVLAPAIMAAIQGWGLTDQIANRSMIVVTVSAAIVKGIGFLIANGETYTTITNDDNKQ